VPQHRRVKVMNNTYIRLFSPILIIFLLTGCLYPESELSKNKEPNNSQLEKVQSAVDQYHEQTDGLLPIKTKDSDTPIFQKYLIDFQALKEQNIMTEIPGTRSEERRVGKEWRYRR